MRLTFKELAAVVSKRYGLDIAIAGEVVENCDFMKFNFKSVNEFVEHLNFLENKGELIE